MSLTLHRYEQVAAHVRQLVENGAYTTGQKLPSVRSLSQQLQVSITTVLEAYRSLEDQLLVEARPQSGYYVSPPQATPVAPAVDLECAEPTPVGTGEFFMQHLRNQRRSDLIQFGTADPNPDDLPVLRLAKTLAKVAREHARAVVSYDIPPGCEELRVQIARRALQARCVVSPDEVMLTLGAQEAIMLCLRATCQAGDTVAVESPTYYGFLQTIESLGLRVVEIPSDPNHGISLTALQQTLDDVPVRAVLLSTTHSNPNGSTLSDSDKEALVDMLGARDIPLIEDDVFGELSFTPKRPRAARSYDKRDLVLLCSSFSKTLSPGFRVGWVLAGPRWMPRLQQLKLFSNLGSPLLPALALSEFLTTSGFEHHLRRARRQYAAQVHGMADAIVRLFPPGTRVTRPKGGFVLWVQLPQEHDMIAAYTRAVVQGMTIGPGPIFSARGRFRNCFRLCAPFWTPQTEPMLVRLAERVFR